MQSSDHILSGVRVVELATVVFVPSSGTVMSDFGAEVIKIEPPGGGDIYRRFHDLPITRPSTGCSPERVRCKASWGQSPAAPRVVVL